MRFLRLPFRKIWLELSSIFALGPTFVLHLGLAASDNIRYNIPSRCRIAQSVEQLTVNQRVIGSSPIAAAIDLGSKGRL